MKKLALIALVLALASPGWATTYYLATAAMGGNDSNNGTSASTPWLTPNHPVKCGDVILAAASTSYSSSNFFWGNWGAVNCPGGNNVAWLKCAAFDACKIVASGGSPGMDVDQSYWGVQGWEITVAANSYAGCFSAVPNLHTQVPVHHIVYANNIANGCFADGFGAGLSVTGSADYVAIVGNIVYNGAAGSACYSGISVYEPIQHDALSGTHIYIAGNFSFLNRNTNPCGGAAPTDGEGIILDTLDGSSGAPVYGAQIVVENNVLLANGGRGLDVYKSSAAPVYVRHNTLWGNNADANETNNLCGEITTYIAVNVHVSFNLAATSAAKGCGGYPLYGYYVADGNSTDVVNSNLSWSATGFYGATSNSPGVSYELNNLFGINPSFVNPTAPTQPNCATAASVPSCMGGVIANFRPTNASALGYGYQIPSTTQTYDPLFPQWLCNVNLPAGLVTMGCLAQSSLPASPTIVGIVAQ